MKVWIYVEGESDEFGLKALWEEWRTQLGRKGHGMEIVPLGDKARLFRKIGPRAAEKLAANPDDRVVGLPDLYPNRDFEQTPYRHAGLCELQQVQQKLVRRALEESQNVSGEAADTAMKRFFPCALKHDLEMLLLAAQERLRSVLKTPEALGNWRKPVEEQNQQTPPRRIVEELFRTRRGRAYRDTVDAPAVLRAVHEIRSILYVDSLCNCPVFKGMLDWVGAQTGIAAYV